MPHAKGHPHHPNQSPPLQSPIPNASRLPESPPFTDVSAACTGSPSSVNSTGGSPFSVDSYSTYNVSSGGPDMKMFPLPMPLLFSQEHPQMHQSAYSLSSYHPSQMSPAEMDRSVPNPYLHPVDMQGYNNNNVYNLPKNDATSIGPAKKRARNEFQSSDNKHVPLFDASRVKNDPTAHSYPHQTPSIPPPTPGMMRASSSSGSESFTEESYRGPEGCQQGFRFSPYTDEPWHKLYDQYNQELHFQMPIVADKGFTLSNKDGCFVNQKKNHFQVSVNIEACDENPPCYVVVNGELKPIANMQLALCGVKDENHSAEIEIRQSQNDRKPGPHKPVELGVIPPRQVTKVTVPRLHFSVTTNNNQRRNFKTHPDQRYFLLLVRLVAVTTDGGSYTILAYASDKIIVRAGNPKQFEDPEAEVGWQSEDGVLYNMQTVSVGTKKKLGGALNVNGDIMLTGQVRQPSDRRLKENIVNLDKKEAMERLNKLRIVEYNYKDEVARTLGMSENAKHRYGIIAQEVEEIHPQSVNKEGEFMTVDENRIFYDNIAAVQELSKLHEDLEVKIDGRVDHMQAFFSKIFRRKDTKPVDGISVISEDSGLAGQKALSTSRYSLASTFKREIAKQSKQEACRNPGCSRYDQSHCSSKLTQGTIITLVVVMAVCLLSMSALYVLDWHHRNYGIHAIANRNSSTDGDPNPPGLMKKTITMPRHQPEAPPLHDMCLHAGCRSFCCDKRVEYSTELRQGGFDINTVVPLAGSKKAFLAAIAGAEKMTPTAFFPKPLFSGTRFVVEGMNMTIDSRYCVERSCNEKKGRYHLFVPVSPYMPTTPVMLRITPPPGMFVQSCGHMLDFQEEECPAEGHPHFTLNMPTSTRVERDLFEISAGSYKRSGYRFRVGTNTESCFGSEERFKSSYEEYNIIFYRTCQGDGAQSVTTIEIESEREIAPRFKASQSNSSLAQQAS